MPTLFSTVGNNTQKGPVFAGQLGGHLVANQNVPNVGDAVGLRGSAVAGNLYIAGHTAEPYTGDAQNANEIAYTGYARIAVPRNTAVWKIIARQQNYSNASLDFFATYIYQGIVYFPRVEAYGGGGAPAARITHLSLGTELSGAGLLMYVCELVTPLQLLVGKVPEIANLQFCEA